MHPDDRDVHLLDHGQMGGLKFIQVLHFVDDHPVQIDPGHVHMPFQKKQVIQDRIPVPADHDEQFRARILGQGEGIQVYGDPIAQISSSLDKQDLSIAPRMGDGLQKLLLGALLIIHVAELGMVKPDTHIHGIFL